MSERLMYNDGFLGYALDRLAAMREAHWDEANRWRVSIEPDESDASYKEARMAEENLAAARLSTVITALKEYGVVQIPKMTTYPPSIRSVYDAPDRIVVARSELRDWANRNEKGESVWRDIDAVLLGDKLK